MDFKGPRLWLGAGADGPLSVIDDHSRYAIVLEPVASTQAGPVRENLEQAFAACGLPEAMLMDHGTPGGAATQSEAAGLAAQHGRSKLRLATELSS